MFLRSQVRVEPPPIHDLQARVITFQDTSAAGGDVKFLP
jgi:hypothetical protein